MADAFGYLADAIVSIVLFFFLLRFLLQLSRADFRNPIARGTMQLTNWLVLPLRKLLPPIGRVDTASVVAVLLIAGAGIGITSLIAGVGLPPADVWLIRTLRMLASNILLLYLLAILVGVVISWVSPGGYSPAQALIDTLTAPILRPIRRVLPAIGGFDFSPVVALLAIQFLRILLRL
jgi:YggT family protein